MYSDDCVKLKLAWYMIWVFWAPFFAALRILEAISRRPLRFFGSFKDNLTTLFCNITKNIGPSKHKKLFSENFSIKMLIFNTICFRFYVFDETFIFIYSI